MVVASLDFTDDQTTSFGTMHPALTACLVVGEILLSEDKYETGSL